MCETLARDEFGDCVAEVWFVRNTTDGGQTLNITRRAYVERKEKYVTNNYRFFLYPLTSDTLDKYQVLSIYQIGSAKIDHPGFKYRNYYIFYAYNQNVGCIHLIDDQPVNDGVGKFHNILREINGSTPSVTELGLIDFDIDRLARACRGGGVKRGDFFASSLGKQTGVQELLPSPPAAGINALRLHLAPPGPTPAL
tara:strand:+ start:539 stop:1126 length:588 start_codon:yes stop_codon:yes gene_type:complete